MQKHKEKEEKKKEGKRKVTSEAAGDSEERGSKRKKEEVSEGARFLRTKRSRQPSQSKLMVCKVCTEICNNKVIVCFVLSWGFFLFSGWKGSGFRSRPATREDYRSDGFEWRANVPYEVVRVSFFFPKSTYSLQMECNLNPDRHYATSEVFSFTPVENSSCYNEEKANLGERSTRFPPIKSMWSAFDLSVWTLDRFLPFSSFFFFFFIPDFLKPSHWSWTKRTVVGGSPQLLGKNVHLELIWSLRKYLKVTDFSLSAVPPHVLPPPLPYASPRDLK